MSEKIVFTPLNYTGWGSLQYLKQEVERFQAKKILLVTDPVLQEIGIVDRVLQPLEELGLSVELYTKVVPEPPLAVGEELVDYARRQQSDLISDWAAGVPSI